MSSSSSLCTHQGFAMIKCRRGAPRKNKKSPAGGASSSRTVCSLFVSCQNISAQKVGAHWPEVYQDKFGKRACLGQWHPLIDESKIWRRLMSADRACLLYLAQEDKGQVCVEHKSRRQDSLLALCVSGQHHNCVVSLSLSMPLGLGKKLQMRGQILPARTRNIRCQTSHK